MIAEDDVVDEEPAEFEDDDAAFETLETIDSPEPEEEAVLEFVTGEELDGAEPKSRIERKKRRLSPAMRQVIAWFSACGRCSFFLAGYRLISDEATLETAVANRGKKWLTVPWSHALAELIHKTYGSRIDISCYYFEGQCLECHRRFTYEGSESDEGAATFRIELRP